MAQDRHIVLLGLMGSGKSSIGRRVAKRLEWPFIDGDTVLEALTGGRPAADVEASEGADSLHELEACVAMEAIRRTRPAVIAPSASVCESESVRSLLADQTVVWLSAPPDFVAGRARRKKHRPLPESDDLEGMFEEQTARRRPLIDDVIDLDVDRTAGSKDQAADAIVAFVERRRDEALTRTVQVPGTRMR